MRVRWTTDAADDLERICNYIALERPDSARRVAESVVERISQLKRFPRIGRPGPTRPRACRVHQKREPAEDKWWNEAREFGVNGVRAQRAYHEGDQDRRSGSSPLGNQDTEATQDFQPSDDMVCVCTVAPMHKPLAPPKCRGAFEFRKAREDKRHSQQDGARPHRYPGKRNHSAPSDRHRVQLGRCPCVAFDHPARTVSTHKTSIPPLNLSSA